MDYGRKRKPYGSIASRFVHRTPSNFATVTVRVKDEFWKLSSVTNLENTLKVKKERWPRFKLYPSSIWTTYMWSQGSRVCLADRALHPNQPPQPTTHRWK